MKITITKITDSTYYHIRGEGPCNWAQPPTWPCDEETLRAHAFPEAGETFLREVARMARAMIAEELKV